MITLQLTYDEIICLKRLCAHAEEYELAMKLLDAEREYDKKPTTGVNPSGDIISLNDT